MSDFFKKIDDVCSPKKPKTFEEVERLLDNSEIDVMLQEEIRGKTHFLICDHRRAYDEGEVYEVVV